MSHHHHCRKKTFWSRRDFLFQSGGGIAGHRARRSPQPTGPAGGRTVRHVRGPDPGEPVRPQGAPLRGAGHCRHLALHERRGEPGRYVRPQARSHDLRRGASGRLGRSTPGQPRDRSCRARSSSTGTAKAEWRSRRSFPHLGQEGRRDCVHPVALRPFERPHPGHLRDAERPDPDGVSQRRVLGHLRTRRRELESARVRRHERLPGWSAGRSQRLERRVHAGHIPGHAVPGGRAIRSSTCNPPRASHRKPSSGRVWTRSQS